MLYLLLLIVFVLGICIGGCGESDTESSFEDYELFEDEDEYPEWVDCEDESDNLYI